MLSGELRQMPSAGVPHGHPQRKPLQCADAGSPYCPCQLAPLGECIECSLMRGEPECNCHWSGTCILANSRWGNGETRQSRKVPVLQVLEPHEKAIIIIVQVTPALAAELRTPGSLVFVRACDNPYFDTPIAVIKTSPEEQTLTLAYKVLGPKTKSLRQARNYLWLRGPYWSGITGRRHIETAKGKSCLLVAGGIAASVLPNIADALLHGGNKVTAVLGKPECTFIERFLPSSGMDIIEMTFPEQKDDLRDLMEKLACQLVFCAGSKALARMTARLSSMVGIEAVFSSSVNQTMCCGEGVCGACLDNGCCDPIRVCKTLR